MTSNCIEFLVALNGKSPNLRESIRRVSNASAGFRGCWQSGQRDEALETSQEAFEHLDYIQNEILRQRDTHRENAATWPTSPLKASLDQTVGRILERISSADSSWFSSLAQGLGSMPAGASPSPLTLQKALNKLKHRDTIALNFALPPGAGHTLYVFTKAGMGQLESLSEIDVPNFCAACRTAAMQV